MDLYILSKPIGFLSDLMYLLVFCKAKYMPFHVSSKRTHKKNSYSHILQ